MISYLKCDYLEKNGLTALYINIINAIAKGLHFFFLCYVTFLLRQWFCCRPCAMCVPDFELICEIMLVAEGFQEARVLARKFITLYTLCKELLSKQDHYDWGLRAIKSVLVVAGSLKVTIIDYQL